MGDRHWICDTFMTPFWNHLCLSLTDCDVIKQNLPKKNQLHNTQHINSTTQYTTYQFSFWFYQFYQRLIWLITLRILPCLWVTPTCLKCGHEDLNVTFLAAAPPCLSSQHLTQTYSFMCFCLLTPFIKFYEKYYWLFKIWVIVSIFPQVTRETIPWKIIKNLVNFEFDFCISFLNFLILHASYNSFVTSTD